MFRANRTDVLSAPGVGLPVRQTEPSVRVCVGPALDHSFPTEGTATFQMFKPLVWSHGEPGEPSPAETSPALGLCVGQRSVPQAGAGRGPPRRGNSNYSLQLF